MQHERQVALLKEAFRHIDAQTTPLADAPYWNPAERYTCSAHFQREMDHLFKGQVPLLAGFSPDLFVQADQAGHALDDGALVA
ncbi:MAG: hypothetical protein ACO241_02185, partial [Burkholderiaceae bacterium]